MSPWEKLLERPHSGGHFVQLYEAGEAGLAGNVGHYVWEGLKRGEGALLIATPEHLKLFSERLDKLGADLSTLFESRQLICWDARQTLARFMVKGQPDWHLFENVIGSATRHVCPANGSETVRTYGDMVGMLWAARQYDAAMRLEQYWNRALEQFSIGLYCAYALDIFGECDMTNLEGVLCAHTHLIPAEAGGRLERALDHAMDSVLGPRAEALRARIQESEHASWAVMPCAESSAIWLRLNLPREAGQILSLARDYYRLQAGSADAAD